MNLKTSRIYNPTRDSNGLIYHYSSAEAFYRSAPTRTWDLKGLMLWITQGS